MWAYALVAGALLTALPAAQYASYRASGDGTASAGPPPELELPSKPPAGRALPDVYFFLLDGYGSREQLRSLAGFDNSPFHEELRRRGLDIAEDATSPYNMTILSVPSILRMDYALEEGRVGGYAPYYETITGENPVVEEFDRLGYDFAFATDWPSPGFIKCTPVMDVCIRPDETLTEREWALLGATPLDAALPELGIAQEDLARKDSVLRPEEAVERIAEERDGDRPLFAYSHLMSSHAPFLYGEDCGIQGLTSVTAWGDPIDGADSAWGIAAGEGGERYSTAVRCLNESLLRAAEAIEASDPNAIVVFAGDHGPGWEFDMTTPPEEWSRADIEMRYSVLSAARLPGCPGRARSQERRECVPDRARLHLRSAGRDAPVTALRRPGRNGAARHPVPPRRVGARRRLGGQRLLGTSPGAFSPAPLPDAPALRP